MSAVARHARKDDDPAGSRLLDFPRVNADDVKTLSALCVATDYRTDAPITVCLHWL